MKIVKELQSIVNSYLTEIKVKGRTSKDKGAELHAHDFEVEVDKEGNVLEGIAFSSSGHTHPITENGVTGPASDGPPHTHSFKLEERSEQNTDSSD